MNLFSELLIEVVPPFKIGFEGVQRLMIPLSNGFLRALLKGRYVDLDILFLSDTIKPADPLFH